MNGGLVSYLVRHGETAHSVARRTSGLGDVPLTERGEAQAHAAAERLRLLVGVEGAQVICSPVRRTRQSADLVAAALGVPVRADEELRERDWGAWEARTLAEIRAEWPREAAAWERDPVVFVPPAGESVAAAIGRVQARWERLRTELSGTVVIVAHATPLQSLLGLAATCQPRCAVRFQLAIASVTRVDWDASGGARLLWTNDVSHLGDLVSDVDRAQRA